MLPLVNYSFKFFHVYNVTNAEVSIKGYIIVRNDRNRNGCGVECYIRNKLCFNIKDIL